MKLGSVEIGRKALSVAAIAVAVVLLGAVTAYAVDSVKRDTIAEGVSVAGVDLSGKDRGEARRALSADLAEPLLRPVRIAFEGKRYTLPPGRIGLRPDVPGMVDEALEASDQGSIFARLWRYTSGGEVKRDLPPHVTYSEPRLDGFIAGFSKRIERPPRNASVDPSASSIEPLPSLDGIEVETAELREVIDTALQATRAGSRVVRARVDREPPELTTKELAADYPNYITVNRGAFTLRYYQNLELVRTYVIAVGQVGYDTPTGLYSIQNKGIDVAWHVPKKPWAGKLAGKTIPGGAPDNPLKARWMGIYNGAGIHGTDQTYSLGSAASHGCLRMAIPDVIELYDQVPIGTPVYIG